MSDKQNEITGGMIEYKDGQLIITNVRFKGVAMTINYYDPKMITLTPHDPEITQDADIVINTEMGDDNQ